MPPGVAVTSSSIASGYAACSLINAADRQAQQKTLHGNFPENTDSHLGISSSSSTTSSSSRSSSASSGESAELSDKDQLQVQSCYKGLKTQVYVCGSMANLYVHNSSANGGGVVGGGVGVGGGAWDLKFTGIPAVLYDSGETRSRDKPLIQILLVERGTCFALWRDTIDNLTSYKVSGQGFHTMCLSTDHTRLIGLSFDCADAAHRLWAHIDRLTSDPENIRLSGPPGNRSKRGRKPRGPAPARALPDKSHISQPCCFEHVTNVEASDRSRYLSLQNLVPAPRTPAVDTGAAAEP